MGLCPAACGGITLVANPTTSCVPSIRRRSFSRFLFFACSTTLPDPMPGSIAPLFADGTIVASSSLVFPDGLPDPSFEDVVIDECSAPLPVASGRIINFLDKYAISETTGSPAVTNSYWNYNFWKNKLDNRFAISYGIVYCNGDVYIPKDSNSNPYTAMLNAFISYEKPATNGGGWVEVIKGTLSFANDPFDITNLPAPDFNLTTEGIVI
jgi:hypothetical protein